MRFKAGVVVGALTAAMTFAFVGSASAQGNQAQAPDECHASYDPCVPIATDVDCASGAGDGPVFIDYPVRVIGEYVYGLDHDGNGTGCEKADSAGQRKKLGERL
jgi:hypothetical protein